MMKLSDSDPDSAWDRVRQLERGMGDLPRWFVWGRRELDGARGGGGGSGHREHAGVRVPGSDMDHGVRYLAQHIEEIVLVLTGV